jgi:ATP-binding cassette subfamily C (CFTR/MRP) protein 1
MILPLTYSDLSPVDAHVGKTLFHSAIMGELRGRGKAVLLVTHALHFVSDVDYIYTVQNGVIEEEGSYAELMTKRAGLYRLLQEHGGTKKEPEENDEEREGQTADSPRKEEYLKKKVKGGTTGKTGGKEDGGTTKEARTTGSVSWKGM